MSEVGSKEMVKWRDAALAAALVAGMSGGAAAQSEKDMIFIPVASYWTGAYGAAGSAFGAGMIDYYKLLNERDGGINGVKLFWEKCETNYQNDRILESYERLKNRCTGAPLLHPLRTAAPSSCFAQPKTANN